MTYTALPAAPFREGWTAEVWSLSKRFTAVQRPILETYLSRCDIDRALIDLVKLRSSQIYGLDASREAPYYSARERAALEWTEAVTRIAEPQ